MKNKVAFRIFTLHCSLLCPADWLCISAQIPAPMYCLFFLNTKFIFIYHGTDPVWMLSKSVHYSKCHFLWTGTELYWQAHYQGLLTDRMNDCSYTLHCQSLTEWVQKLSATFVGLKDSDRKLEKKDVCKRFTCAAFINLVQTSQLLPKLLH